MSQEPLKVIFLWHMHQPDYRDTESGSSMMPWVRLHGTKDYLDMVTILDDFPNVRQNFNLVPSLLDQLQGYVDGNLTDKNLELTIKKADSLTVDEKVFILDYFFHAHWDNMVRPFPRYWELLKMRGFHPAHGSLNDIQRYFSNQDFLDLQIWYNLIWIDPVFHEQYDFLPNLIRRGRNFNETDKVELLNIQQKILGRIIPAYRERQERGQIELSTTPYYHPILPLLYDTNLAEISQPYDPLPNLRFSHPEDVSAQIDRAVKQHEYYFGSRPKGMWPSEGSVCQEIIPFFERAGIKWIATDEG
ncbi:MAG TPA: glycoside hydrolase family 57, partial [Desulfarculaceae bacterium]|nr:glycoside hydrolase family 57 [Desulfarculaceae bacterium]